MRIVKANLMSLTLCLPEAALGSLGRTAKLSDGSELDAKKTAKIAYLQKALSDEKELTAQKDDELARMQLLMSKLEAAVKHQSKILCLEQSRFASLEESMKQRLENQLLQDKVLETEATNAKMDRLLEVLLVEKNNRSLAEEASEAAEARAAAAEAEVAELRQRFTDEVRKNEALTNQFAVHPALGMSSPAKSVGDAAPEASEQGSPCSKLVLAGDQVQGPASGARRIHEHMLDQLQKQKDMLYEMIEKDRQLGMVQKKMNQEMAKTQLLQADTPSPVKDSQVPRWCEIASSLPVNGAWQATSPEPSLESLAPSSTLLQSHRSIKALRLNAQSCGALSRY